MATSDAQKLAELRNELNELQELHRDTINKIISLISDVAELLTNQQLEPELAVENTVILEVNKQTLTMIKMEVDSVLFSRVKFLENDDQINKATNNVYDLIFDSTPNAQLGPIHRLQWCKIYAHHVIHYLNIKRALGTQQVRTMLFLGESVDPKKSHYLLIFYSGFT